MTVTTSAKVIGRPQMDHSSKSIHEFGSSSDSRSMTTSVFGSNSASTGESIRIGNWIYTRFGKDAWSRKEYAIATPAPAKESADMGFELSGRVQIPRRRQVGRQACPNVCQDRATEKGESKQRRDLRNGIKEYILGRPKWDDSEE